MAIEGDQVRFRHACCCVRSPIGWWPPPADVPRTGLSQCPSPSPTRRTERAWQLVPRWTVPLTRRWPGLLELVADAEHRRGKRSPPPRRHWSTPRWPSPDGRRIALAGWDRGDRRAPRRCADFEAAHRTALDASAGRRRGCCPRPRRGGGGSDGAVAALALDPTRARRASRPPAPRGRARGRPCRAGGVRERRAARRRDGGLSRPHGDAAPEPVRCRAPRPAGPPPMAGRGGRAGRGGGVAVDRGRARGGGHRREPERVESRRRPLRSPGPRRSCHRRANDSPPTSTEVAGDGASRGLPSTRSRRTARAPSSGSRRRWRRGSRTARLPTSYS